MNTQASIHTLPLTKLSVSVQILTSANKLAAYIQTGLRQLRAFSYGDQQVHAVVTLRRAGSFLDTFNPEMRYRDLDSAVKGMEGEMKPGLLTVHQHIPSYALDGKIS